MRMRDDDGTGDDVRPKRMKPSRSKDTLALPSSAKGGATRVDGSGVGVVVARGSIEG